MPARQGPTPRAGVSTRSERAARGCLPEQRAETLALLDRVMRAGSDQTIGTDYPLVYGPSNLANVQVRSVGGRVVAVASLVPLRVRGPGFTFGCGNIAPTATDPDHRHRGYALECVEACVDRMLALGLVVSVLWTVPPTFALYERAGYQAVASFGSTYPLRATDAGRFAPGDGDVARLATSPMLMGRLHALRAERSAGVRRSLAEDAALFRLPKVTTWLALRGGVLAGYLVESHASNRPGLLESGGDPVAIAGLLRHVLERLSPADRVPLHVGLAPDPLSDLAAHALRDAERNPFAAHMMVRLNDPLGFLRAVRPWRAADRPGHGISVGVTGASGDTEAVVSIEPRRSGLAIGTRRLRTHVQVTRGELTSILFGSHPERPVRVPSELQWIRPFQIPLAILDRS